MLRSVSDLDALAVEATDGAIGHLKDLYFDYCTWVIRYLVVESGSLDSIGKVFM